MLGVKLDPDLERVLEQDVDDLARYNILRYLHDHPQVQGDVDYFVDHLGLRSIDRTRDALEGLASRGLLERISSDSIGPPGYRLSTDPTSRELVDRLYLLSSSFEYGAIVERLAARSLHRARRGPGGGRARHSQHN